jgi:lysophospholipase L1-like esterase
MKRFCSTAIGPWELVLVSSFVTLTLFEIGLRFFAPQYGNYVQPDDVIEYSFIPAAYYAFSPPEPCPGWGSSGRINSHGLRDSEHGYAKPPGTFRILALGDSYTEGFQLDLERTWPKLLERRLNEQHGGLKYEVINAGRSAMGTGTQYLYYLDKGRNYDPDLVLLLFIPNDFRENSRQLTSRLQPYFTLSQGHLRLDTTFAETGSYRLRKLIHPLKRLYLVSFATQSYNKMKAQLEAPIRTRGAHAATLTSYEQTAVEITRRLLLELSEAVTQNKGRFAIIIGTANYEVNWTDTQGPEKTHDFLTSNADQIITTFAEREGVSYLNLEPVLREYSTQHQALIHGCLENRGGGHWSETGHAVAATAIYEFLVDQALVP